MTQQLALITGATSGIGRATAELLAKKGVNLILSGRNQSELIRLQKVLSQHVDVQVALVNLAIPSERRILIDLLHTHTPNLVINNAGFGLYGNALSYPVEQQLEILEVNGRAVLEITLEAGRALIDAKKQGVILNVSSAAAFYVMPNMAVYAAAKAFVNQFSQSLDYEFKHVGVRVLTLCPGMVSTQFQGRAGGSIDQNQGGVMTASFVAEQIWNQIEGLNPLLVIDWKYRLLTRLSFFLPSSWFARAIEQLIAKRITNNTHKKWKN